MCIYKLHIHLYRITIFLSKTIFKLPLCFGTERKVSRTEFELAINMLILDKLPSNFLTCIDKCYWVRTFGAGHQQGRQVNETTLKFRFVISLVYFTFVSKFFFSRCSFLLFNFKCNMHIYFKPDNQH